MIANCMLVVGQFRWTNLANFREPFVKVRPILKLLLLFLTKNRQFFLLFWCKLGNFPQVWGSLFLGLTGPNPYPFREKCDNFESILIVYRVNLVKFLPIVGKFCNKPCIFLKKRGKIGKILAPTGHFLAIFGLFCQ